MAEKNSKRQAQQQEREAEGLHINHKQKVESALVAPHSDFRAKSGNVRLPLRESRSYF